MTVKRLLHDGLWTVARHHVAFLDECCRSPGPGARQAVCAAWYWDTADPELLCTCPWESPSCWWGRGSSARHGSACSWSRRLPAGCSLCLPHPVSRRNRCDDGLPLPHAASRARAAVAMMAAAVRASAARPQWPAHDAGAVVHRALPGLGRSCAWLPTRSGAGCFPIMVLRSRWSGPRPLWSSRQPMTRAEQRLLAGCHPAKRTMCR